MGLASDREEVEQAFHGGSVTTVGARGRQVRRQQNRSSAAVHGVLRHLESVGFDGAPRLMWIDHDNREVLTWIEGVAATRPSLARLSRLLRGDHEAVANYRPPDDAVWWTGARPLAPGEIVRHGDLGPSNTIWRNEAPVALIDRDFAEPGPAA